MENEQGLMVTIIPPTETFMSTWRTWKIGAGETAIEC